MDEMLQIYFTSVDSGPTGGCVGFCARATGPTDQKSNFFPTFGPRSGILIHWIKFDWSGPLDKTTVFRNFLRFWTKLVIIIVLTQILSIDNVWSRQTKQTTCLPLLMPH